MWVLAIPWRRHYMSFRLEAFSAHLVKGVEIEEEGEHEGLYSSVLYQLLHPAELPLWNCHGNGGFYK